LQEKIAINKIAPAREERNNILKGKNIISQEQNKLLKNQNFLLEAILSELKQFNNLTIIFLSILLILRKKFDFINIIIFY